jgi:hypothetical protein
MMPINKQHKAFRLDKIMPIDANNIILEQAFARFLALMRTKGIPITTTTKETLYPKSLVKLIADDPTHFQGMTTDPHRKQLLEDWLANEFATTIKVGRSGDGEARIANMKPIHMSTIKLLDPRIRSQDRDLSKFLFNVFQDSDLIMGSESLLLPYLTVGTADFGDHDSKIDESKAAELDIETLFLLRLLNDFKVDKVDKKKRIAPHDFICPGQRQLIINDTARLLVYKDSMPRRELIDYLIMLFAFHAALYCLKSFRLINHLADTGQYRCRHCRGINMANLDRLSECEYQPDIFVDLTNGQDNDCDRMAKDKVANHHAVMYRYFSSHYKLKKVDEFASTFPGYTGSMEDLVKFFTHKDLDAFFRMRLSEIIAVEENEELDADIKAIRDLNMSPLETFVEIVTQKTFDTRSRNHKSLLASLCGMGKESGFLMGGRGRKRKYVLGNQLLELLVQLSVVGYNTKQGFFTQPIVITDFVEWLRKRYGLLIDCNKGAEDTPEGAKALENNFNALKIRLRQLGFYTDLSDASNSQVIRPRFTI